MNKIKNNNDMCIIFNQHLKFYSQFTIIQKIIPRITFKKSILRMLHLCVWNLISLLLITIKKESMQKKLNTLQNYISSNWNHLNGMFFAFCTSFLSCYCLEQVLIALILLTVYDLFDPCCWNGFHIAF